MANKVDPFQPSTSPWDKGFTAGSEKGAIVFPSGVEPNVNSLVPIVQRQIANVREDSSVTRTDQGYFKSLTVSGDLTPTNVNLLEYTQTFTAPVWTKSLVTSTVITENTMAAPDGTMTADTLTEIADFNGYNQYFKPTSSAQITMSLFVKQLRSPSVQTSLGIWDYTAASSLFEMTGLWTGNAITSVAKAAGSSGGALAFADFGNGWYRLSAVISNATDVTHNYKFYGYARTLGNAGSIGIWGAQVQMGTVLTAYAANGGLGSATGTPTALQGNAAVGGNLTVLQSMALGGLPISASTYDLLPAGTTAQSTLRVPAGVAPTSPVDGDVWSTTAGLFMHVNGKTVGPFLDSVTTLSPFLLMGG